LNFELPEEMTVASVNALSKKLQNVLNELDQKELILEGSKVKDIDAAGIQVLLSAYKSLAAKNKSIKLKTPSSELEQALKNSGADAIF